MENVRLGQISEYFQFILIGISISLLYHYFLKKDINTANKNKEDNIKTEKQPLTEYSFEQENIIVREQLKRNYEFFKDEGMSIIKNSFVVIVGVGGIGSHALMTLVRSGIHKMRIIDHNNVDSSILSRHAFAYLDDIGTPIVDTCKSYINKINPLIVIENLKASFNLNTANELILKENPNYVIDCLSSAEAKVDLMYFCKLNKLKLLSCFNATGKKDPTCIRVTELANIQNNSIATNIKSIYKQKYDQTIPKVNIVFSIEPETTSNNEINGINEI